MFRSSIMRSDWWKCGKYASSQLWGVYIFDDVGNILGTSYSIWWHMNQRFEADCCKIYAHMLKGDQKQNQLALGKGLEDQAKRKETSILSSEQEMKAGFMVMTQEQSNSHPSGRVILPSKRVETDEVRLQEHVVCFFEQWGNSSEGVYSSVPACESRVLHRRTEGSYGSCWEKMPNKWYTQDWLLHHDNMPCHTDSQLFLVPNQKRWCWYLASVLLQPSLQCLFWFSKIETWLKGWRFKDIMKTKLNRRQRWSALLNRSCRGVSRSERDTG